MTNPNHTDTSRSGDLVERLRGDKYTCRENMGCGTMEFCACATMEDAADRIEALEAENERLRFHLDTALEALIMEGVCDGECGACKEARAALGEKS